MKKQEDKEFYDKITKKSSSISLVDLEDMFPGDDKIIEKFMKFKEQKGDFSCQANNRSYDNFKSKRKDTGESIRNASFENIQNSTFNHSFEKVF